MTKSGGNVTKSGDFVALAIHATSPNKNHCVQLPEAKGERQISFYGNGIRQNSPGVRGFLAKSTTPAKNSSAARAYWPIDRF